MPVLLATTARYRFAASSVFLALAPLTRLLKVLVLAEIRQDAGLLTLFLEATESAFEGLPIFDPNPGHRLIAPFPTG